jgi:hypothetical protein
MPDLEVVAKIEDLVNNTEPTIAPEIMAYVKVAQDYHKKAEKVYEILTSGKLVKPKMSSRKTIAVSENTATVSGWDSLNLKWKKAIAEQLNLSLEQKAKSKNIIKLIKQNLHNMATKQEHGN